MEEVEFHGFKIPKGAADKAQELIDAAGEQGQFKAFDIVKKDLAARFPEVFAEVDIQKTKLRDLWPTVDSELTKLRTPPKPEKKEPQETPEMARARLEAEYAQKTAEAMKKVRLDAAIEQVKSAAIANKLDPDYLAFFEHAVKTVYPADINGDSVIFLNGDLPLINGDAPAKPEDVAAMLLKKYPKFVSSPTPGPKLGEQKQQTPQLKAQNASTKIESGIAEVFKAS